MRFTKLQKRRIRKNFAKKDEILEIPYLLSVQIESFKRFIEKDPKGKNGIAGIFEKIFPIKSSRGEAELRFIDYELGEPKYTPEECRDRGLTYSRPLNANLRLITYDKNSLNSGTMVVSRSVPSEKPVYFGDIPVMTEHGSFIINGTDNVTVSQLHRAPGVIFEKEIPKNGDQSKGVIYKSRIIPYRGSWIDFSFDNNRDSINLEIDKKKKMPATVLLHAFGYSDSEILAYLYDEVPYRIINGKLYGSITAVSQLSQNNALLATEVRGIDGEVVLQADPTNSRRIGDREFDLFEMAYDARGVEYFELPVEVLDSSIIMEDVYSPRTGELLLPANYQFSEDPQEMFDTLVAEGVEGFSTIYLDPENGSYISNTLRIDKTHNADDACLEIYALMNDEGASNASEATQERIDTAKAYFSRLFSNERYDLSPVGRMKLDLGVMTGNKDRDDQLQEVQLTKIVVDDEGHEEAVVITHDERLQKSEIDGRDILDVLYKLCLIRNTGTGLDDVDDLGYRRLRPVGEQIENSFRIGLVRVQKAVQERLNHGEIDSLTPNALINHRPVSSAIREFFTGSKLSQFMDQNNALAEVTHKRRISALGQGGVTRERAGFEVRDVHVTHYGRICPIETPEGQNIGLINSLATYARPNRFGFLETPYRVVKNGRVTDEIKYLSPLDEKQEIYIAQANAKLDKDNHFIGDTVPARLHGNTDMVPVEKIQYMDISSKQTVSIAAALIPFLENDDAKRVLMGANMQKQAVPTLKAEKPLVGTGVENIVAKDSGVSVVAKRGGKINYVDALQIIVEVNPEEIIPDSADPGVDIYNLVKYRRSNQNTVLNQKPSVNIGDVVERGEVIADGSATDLGELALGQNMRVAFMPWNGYNYEDSILVSERVVQQDRFTSIHIQEVTCEARETKNGNEEITADIPNVSNELLSRLDENGIIHIGAEVKTGDILVGRTTPKTDTNTSNYAEMKLLNQIFNVKSAEVKDSSLRVPNSVQGTVIDVQIFTRQDVEKDQRTLAIEAKALKEAEDNIRNRAEIIRGGIKHRLFNLMVESGHKASEIESYTLEALAELKPAQAVRDEVVALIERAHEELASIPEKIEREKEKLLNYENLKPQVLKQIKVYIAIKRQIQPADKMAGRHGNKGVISKINPVEDMPYDENGTPIDIALNPIGVPSRMNLGQILETHLGLAAKGIGDKIKQMLYRKEKVSKLREFIQEAYNVGHAIQKVNLEHFSDEEVLVLAENLREGLPVASPVFDGAKEEEIHQLLDLAGYPHSGQITLYDGRTGQKFDRPVTVGYMYMLKLNHLVDDKMHARSIGSYSLVTQQPLGGKAQFGGQRFGEMEVWALQAYGAAYNLQEMLTVKSDDIEGRREIFQNILEGRHEMIPHTPELFNVLMKEIKSVGLNMEFIDDSEEDL